MLFLCFAQILDTLPPLPTQSCDYSELGQERVNSVITDIMKQVVNATQIALNPQKQLLFNTLLCLTIQKSSKAAFSDEELSLFTHGKPLP